MYDRLLVAVDHSRSLGACARRGQGAGPLSKGKVWVLHLREREVIAQMGDVPSRVGRRGGAGGGRRGQGADQAGMEAHGEVRKTTFGHAAREILADAKEHDVNVIIMGSRGRGDLAGAVLGSTAHKVIHLADRPVLVVR